MNNSGTRFQGSRMRGAAVLISKRAIALALLSFVMLCGPAFAAPCGKVTYVEGRIDVLHVNANLAVAVSQGDPVEKGDIFRAKSKSKAEITLSNRNILRMGPGTRIEITEAETGTASNSSVVRLFRGRVQAIAPDELVKKTVALAEGRKFEVHTENAVAGIRDTNMLVSYEGGVTSVIFLSGKGYLYNPDMPANTITLTSGYMSIVTGTGTTPTPATPANDEQVKYILLLVTPPSGSDQDNGGPAVDNGGGGGQGPQVAGGGSDEQGDDVSGAAGPIPLQFPTGNIAVSFDIPSLPPLPPLMPPPQTIPKTAGNNTQTVTTPVTVVTPPTITVTSLLLGQDAGTSASYNLSTGAINAGSEYIGYAGAGTFNHSGGSNIVSGSIFMGGGADVTGGTGAYNLSGGTLSVGGNIYVGYNLPLTDGSAVFNQGTPVYTNGVWSTPAGNAQVTGSLYIAGSPDNTSGSGTYNLYNGTLTTGSTYVGLSTTSWWESSGVFNQGTPVSLPGAGSYTPPGGSFTTGSLYVGGGQGGTWGVGYYNLNAGTLTANSEYIGIRVWERSTRRAAPIRREALPSALMACTTSSRDPEHQQPDP